jgi:hypothetical protein
MDAVGLGVLVVGAVAVFAGYAVFAVTAFGASFLVVPILSHLLPLSFVLPVCVLLDFTASLTLGLHSRADMDRVELMRLIPFSLVGAVIGVTALVKLPREGTLLALGVFLLGYAAWSLREGGRLRRVGAVWAPVAGLAGGMIGTLFGVGGPPYVIYLSRRIEDKARLRATISGALIVNLGMRLAVFTVAGLMLRDGLLMYAALVPFAALGLWCGTHLQRRLSRDAVVRVLNGLLLLLATSLIVRALTG